MEPPEPSSSSSGDGERLKKVYVAVGARGEAMVLWALQKFPKESTTAFVLLHVVPQQKLIPISTCVSGLCFFPTLFFSGSQLVVFILLPIVCSIMPDNVFKKKIVG